MGSIASRDFRSEFVRAFTRGALLFALGLLLSACAKNTGDGGPSYRPQTPEKPYTGNSPISYGPPIASVTATARYLYYDDTGATGLNSIGAAKPIRHVEVQILDAAGNEIQRGETDAAGNISMAIPRAAGQYVLRVNSRAENNQYKASVLADPYDTQYYSLDTPFTLDGSEANLAVTVSPAPAANSSSLMGGAFSILDQVLVANDYLRGSAAGFTVAPKIQIFWQKGLTPAAYYGMPQTPISFFLAESGSGLYRGIYVLGGIEGDVCTDTDHFDRSVILHEYGHFLENAFGKSSSPGGPHNGNEQLDPRLAWSEGWADFFQAAALSRDYYRDTKRNGGCPSIGLGVTAQLSFPDFKMEEKNGTDIPATNEGIFREISVARTLYDVKQSAAEDSAHSAGDSRYAEMGFGPIWTAFQTIGTNAFSFQNMGQLNMTLLSIANSGPYDPQLLTHVSTGVFANEKQVANQSQYAEPRSLKSAARGSCSATFQENAVVPDDRDSEGYTVATDMLRSNDYYRYDYDGNPANAVLILRYYQSGGSISIPYDLDVYVYNEKHTLLDPADMRARSEAHYPESGGNGTYPGYEYINLTGAPAGRYLINVKAYYLTKRGDTTYFLESPSGALQLCP